MKYIKNLYWKLASLTPPEWIIFGLSLPCHLVVILFSLSLKGCGLFIASSLNVYDKVWS